MSVQHSNSEIRKASFLIAEKIYLLVRPHTGNTLANLVDWFFSRHSKKIIEQKTDEELKAILKDGYDTLKPIFDQTDLGYQLSQAKRLGCPMPADIGDLKKAMELVKDVMR